MALRSSEILVGAGGRPLATLVPLSGLFVWGALACVTANVIGAIAGARRRHARHTREGRSA